MKTKKPECGAFPAGLAESHNANPEAVKLHFGDCMKIMGDLPESSIDLILCDLPYGTTDRAGLGGKKGKNRLYAWDKSLDLTQLWTHYRRLLKPNGNVVLTADQPFTSQLVVSNLKWFKYDLIWDKMRVNGFLLANSRPMKQTEDIVVFSPLGAAPASRSNGQHMTYNPQELQKVSIKKRNSAKRLGNFLHNPDHLGKNSKLTSDKGYEQKYTGYPKEILEFPLDECVHPTQKPVALMEYLVRTYSNEGDAVMDNCMGSGSTGVAAIRAKRRFIGIEANEEYFLSAQKRINTVGPLHK